MAASDFEARFKKYVSTLTDALGAPTYAQNGFILFKGDCVDLLARLSQSTIRPELTVTSPPYNIGKEYEKPLPLNDYLQWCSQWLKGIHAVTADQGALWLNLGYVDVEGRGKAVPLPYLMWNLSPFYLRQEVVWNYGAGVSSKRSFSPRNEKWLFYTRAVDSYTFNLDDVRDPDVKYPNQKKNGKLRCNPLGKNPSDVWQIAKVTSGKNRSSKERTSHPAQFPLALVDRIVRVSSNPCDIVMDPFSGSGSTGIAAVGSGRVFLGFELREDYCRLAIERFENYSALRKRNNSQLKIFNP
ncbi:site-specific DNA-methyltransferase [Myxococcus sp. AM010]|uniref:DNA-methyltransferase n=1 Tax=Myxococcus sp. AM010 TaxID=2745138 RepID=UPI001C3D1000|nr:site-specific DNA-methyltransferase [Myxococcus sp. AM010]